jgi:hypothetical protein
MPMFHTQIDTEAGAAPNGGRRPTVVVAPIIQGGSSSTLFEITLPSGASDKIILGGMLSVPTSGIPQVTFAGGTTLSGAQLVTMAETGSRTNTRPYGTAGHIMAITEALILH